MESLSVQRHPIFSVTDPLSIVPTISIRERMLTGKKKKTIKRIMKSNYCFKHMFTV